MGEIADDIIDGRSCAWCGSMFTVKHGYPVVCKGCWKEATPEERTAVQKAIYPEW
jgi:hypothetical protein